jgi:hypothetical protein
VIRILERPGLQPPHNRCNCNQCSSCEWFSPVQFWSFFLVHRTGPSNTMCIPSLTPSNSSPTIIGSVQPCASMLRCSPTPSSMSDIISHPFSKSHPLPLWSQTCALFMLGCPGTWGHAGRFGGLLCMFHSHFLHGLFPLLDCCWSLPLAPAIYHAPVAILLASQTYNFPSLNVPSFLHVSCCVSAQLLSISIQASYLSSS